MKTVAKKAHCHDSNKFRNGIAYYVPIFITVRTYLCLLSHVYMYSIQYMYIRIKSRFIIRCFFPDLPISCPNHFVGQIKLIQVLTSLC
jgi:hypothetical protein